MPAAIFATFALLLGACVGSFLNVCIGRWPHDMSVVSPPSRCPKCERPIRWFENVPVLGWLALRGKCRGCRQSISVEYPVVELVIALGWLAAMAHYGFGFTALRVAVFGTVLFGIAVTDLKHYLIPDGFTIFGFFWTLVTAAIAWFTHESSPFVGPYDALIGACVGAGMIAIIGWLGEAALDKEAMGMGDVTLMAVVGAALGPLRSLTTIFVAAAIAAITFLVVVYPIGRLRWHRRRGGPAQIEVPFEPPHDPQFEMPLVPFGVFLAPAGLLTLLYGERALRWYVETVLTT